MMRKIQLPLAAEDLANLQNIEATYSVLLTNLSRERRSQ